MGLYMRNDEDKDNLKSLFEKIFGVSWPEEWDTNGTSQKKRGKSVGESLVSRTDWRWAYEDQTPQYRLSEDETEILADYADYEETYIRIPRNRKEFEELD